jgi:hypothetical protein
VRSAGSSDCPFASLERLDLISPDPGSTRHYEGEKRCLGDWCRGSSSVETGYFPGEMCRASSLVYDKMDVPNEAIADADMVVMMVVVIHVVVDIGVARTRRP